MDFHKLSGFILLFGAVVLAFGGYQYLSNQPMEVKEPSENVFESLNRAVTAFGKNIGRAEKREESKTIMLIGGIILFAGIAVRASSGKKG